MKYTITPDTLIVTMEEFDLQYLQHAQPPILNPIQTHLPALRMINLHPRADLIVFFEALLDKLLRHGNEGLLGFVRELSEEEACDVPQYIQLEKGYITSFWR